MARLGADLNGTAEGPPDGEALEGTAVLRQPAGVMLRGRWIDRAELDRMLEDLEGDA